MSTPTTQDTTTLLIHRRIAAPIERVYDAWTDPARVARWFLPNERWLRAETEFDLRPGGAMKIAMFHQDGDVFNNEGEFLELDPPNRVKFSWRWLQDPDGSGESVVTIELRPAEGGTDLTLRHEQLPAASSEATSEGWEGCLGGLERYLAGEAR